ncbi:Clp protease N-terminal domain-containing protein [Amycolatopsis anabasis]|uniref:Clp protease N-terminal domain-containing protein n=1 Tax=Amycolatopsis anabasis TaxID=1840409 RepID=UPI003CCD365F
MLTQREQAGRPQPSGLAPAEVLDRIRRLAPPGEHESPSHMPFTAEAKKLLELSLREALRAQHGFIADGHILAAIAMQDEGIAARILTESEIDRERLHEEALDGVSPPLPGERVRFEPHTEARVARLEHAVDRLTAQVAELRRQLGERD